MPKRRVGVKKYEAATQADSAAESVNANSVSFVQLG